MLCPPEACGWLRMGLIDQNHAQDRDRSIFKGRGVRLLARVCTLDRLIFPQGGFPLDVDLFAVDQTRRFVGLF
jgi:hypothetical protein